MQPSVKIPKLLSTASPQKVTQQLVKGNYLDLIQFLFTSVYITAMDQFLQFSLFVENVSVRDGTSGGGGLDFEKLMLKTEPDIMPGRRGRKQQKLDLVDKDGNSKFCAIF